MGYVLEGRLAIGFSTNIVEFKAGDGLFILPGEDDKHKAKVRKGDKALLILFEEI